MRANSVCLYNRLRQTGKHRPFNDIIRSDLKSAARSRHHHTRPSDAWLDLLVRNRRDSSALVRVNHRELDAHHVPRAEQSHEYSMVLDAQSSERAGCFVDSADAGGPSHAVGRVRIAVRDGLQRRARQTVCRVRRTPIFGVPTRIVRIRISVGASVDPVVLLMFHHLACVLSGTSGSSN
jgi:hypothetical protein